MIEEVAKELRDKDAGWVTRRDAALKLGEIANEALRVLHEHVDESDVDVRRGVNDAVQSVAKMFRGVELQTTPESVSLDDAIKALEKPGQRDVERGPRGFVVNVTSDDGRTQKVYVTPFEWKDGTKLVRVYTRCGPMSEDAVRWALRTNLKITHGALALAKEGDGEEFVMTNCFLADELTEDGLKASVKELAHYGDWIEKKLTGLDEL